MSLQIPKTSQDTLDTLLRILGGNENARHSLNAAYAMGAMDAALRLSQPVTETKEAA